MDHSTPMQGEENAQRDLKTLGEFLEEDGWHAQVLEDSQVYQVGFGGENAQTACYAQIRADLEQFLSYVMAPVKAPDELRPVVAEFLTRANYGMRIGNSEMDFGDGEVRFKSSLDFEKATLTHELIKNAISLLSRRWIAICLA